MSFDLSQFDTATAANNGAVLHLLDDKGQPCFLEVDGKKIPVQLHLYGSDSDYFNFAKQKAAQEMAAAMRPEPGTPEAAAGKPRKMTDEEYRQMRIDGEARILAEITAGWTGIPDSDGKEMPFSREAAFEIYRKYNVIRAQVDAFIANRKNFS